MVTVSVSAPASPNWMEAPGIGCEKLSMRARSPIGAALPGSMVRSPKTAWGTTRTMLVVVVSEVMVTVRPFCVEEMEGTLSAMSSYSKSKRMEACAVVAAARVRAAAAVAGVLML